VMDVAIADGHVVAVEQGSTSRRREVGVPAGTTAVGTRAADAAQLPADGAWLMPGLWDAHVHPTDWAAARHRLDLSGCPARSRVLAAVAARLAAEPAIDELIGVGLRHALWTQGRRGDLLDGAA